jgi:hypothetical protein
LRPLTIRVRHLDRTDPRRLSAFNDLSEAIWLAFRDNGRVAADLAAVDHGSDTLIVTTRDSLLRRTVQTIGAMVDSHGMSAEVSVEVDSQ